MIQEMNPDKMMELFEELADRLHIELVLGTGDFVGGSCILKNQKYVILNKKHPIESRLKILASEFKLMDVTDVYIVPALRELNERICFWRHSKFCTCRPWCIRKNYAG